MSDAGDRQPGTELAQLESQVGTRAYWRNEGGIRDRYAALLAESEVGAGPPVRQDVTTPTPTRPVKKTYRDMLARHDREAAAAPAAQEIAPAEATPPPARRMTDKELVDVNDHRRASEADSWRAAPDAARAGMPAQLVAQWDESALGFEGNLHRAQDVTRAIVVDISDAAEADTFVRDFRALPDAVRAAVLVEAAMPKPGILRPTTPRMMTDFATFLAATVPRSSPPGPSCPALRWTGLSPVRTHRPRSIALRVRHLSALGR